MKPMTWTIADHLCRSCGGRILRSATGAGMTPGGNPVWKCADCGRATSGIGPTVLCWCGHAHRNNNAGAYRCVAFSAIKEHPALDAAFRACGSDPGRGEVGIVLAESLRAIRRDGEGR